MSDLDRRLSKLEDAAGADPGPLTVVFVGPGEPEPDAEPSAGGMRLLVRFVAPMPDGPHGRA